MKNSSAYAIPGSLSQPSARLVYPVESERPAVVRDSANRVLLAVQAVARILAAVAVSTVSAWCVTSMLSMSFDWGYELVKAGFGQPPSSQGVVAGMSLWFVIMPFSCALIFGALKHYFKAPWFWNLVPVALASSVVTFDLVADGDFQAIAEMAPWGFLACLVAYGGYFAGQKILSGFPKADSQRLLVAGIASCAPAGILCALSINLNFRLELVLCIATVFSAAMFISQRTVQSSLSYRVKLIAVSMTPILLPLLLNAAGATALLVLGQFGVSNDLGWRASLSAIILLLSTAITGIAGSIVGVIFNSREKFS